MSDYRVDAATKEEWALRAWSSEAKCRELEEKYKALLAEKDSEISGWFETEYGAEMVLCTSAANDEDLAVFLLGEYGEMCVGVDMELEGFYRNGKEVNAEKVCHFLEVIFLETISEE